MTSLKIVGDGKDFIEVKLKPPDYVEDPELGTGTLNSITLFNNLNIIEENLADALLFRSSTLPLGLVEEGIWVWPTLKSRF